MFHFLLTFLLQIFSKKCFCYKKYFQNCQAFFGHSECEKVNYKMTLCCCCCICWNHRGFLLRQYSPQLTGAQISLPRFHRKVCKEVWYSVIWALTEQSNCQNDKSRTVLSRGIWELPQCLNNLISCHAKLHSTFLSNHAIFFNPIIA